MDIDVSKENIQPLRGGRNPVQLGTALQAQNDVDAQRQLQLQKDEHEAAIRHYQGSDPLDPWFNYIQWVEQSYPKHGYEGHIDKLIKDCLQLFEKDERYYQDRRLVKLWIKYVDCLSNPLEIYQRLYNTGIGVECSEFYRAWACYCEESGDYKKANQVYMLGLQAKAQPLDELEQAHMNFQLFFAQRMLHDDSPTKRKAASALAETRMALTSLKSFKRRNIANVPVQRIGDNIKNVVPGVVRQQHGNYDNRMPNSNVMVNVYEDAPSTSHAAIPVVENPGPASLVQACNVENEKEVGIWTNAKTKMVHSNVVPHVPLPFTLYEDSDDMLKLSANHKAYCVEDLSFTVPLCVPDPPDPTKTPCYNKSQVYVNDKEYSLEEIRSRKYNLDRKPKTESPEVVVPLQKTSSINESLAQCSALETLANCALDAEQDHLGQLMPLAMPSVQNITKVTNMHSPGEPKVLVNLDSKEFSELSTKKNDENQRLCYDKENQHEVAPSAYGAENGGNFGRNNLMEEFNRSLMSNLLGDSVTVNTKEARWELRNLFNDNEPSMVQPVMQQMDMPNFDIHEDRSMTMAINTKKKHEIGMPKCVPEDKENAKKFTVPAAPPNVNKTACFEEPACTQVFNLHVNGASTPRRDTEPAALSVIMEATREYNSKSGSSSSGQSTRTNLTGYTTTHLGEKTHASNYDSTYQQQAEVAGPRRGSAAGQMRLPNGQFARGYPQKPPDGAAPYLSHDHQYQKPAQPAVAAAAAAYNGYSPQRQMHTHYQQQGYNYQPQPAYQQQQLGQQYTAYHSPQRAGPAAPPAPVASPFQSPTYPGQVGYHSPQHAAVSSPQHAYGGRADYHYPAQDRTHAYAAPQPPAAFQSPPHQPQYYPRVSRTGADYPPAAYHSSPHAQYGAATGYAAPEHHASPAGYDAQQSPYRQPPKHATDAGAGYAMQGHQSFQVYQSPQQTSYRVEPSSTQAVGATPEQLAAPHEPVAPPRPHHRSPTSALRNIRHDQPAAKAAQNTSDVGFSNQFLNFISNRNEPKDNANTPKFTNSPSISQKMHKNLYVSSPEQAQIPPSSGLSDSDSKDGLTAQTITPIQSAKVTHATEKAKDISKRQLDFEHRVEFQSEDSRDSVSKESRISSVYSRQSDFQDGYGMDVDSENSMECAAFKSTHSISLVETSELPRPADIDFPAVIDPFNKKILASLLEYVKFPNKTHADGYVEVRSVPKLQTATVVTVGNNKFSVEKQLGKGNYGAVFLCLDLHSNRSVAVKYQKPSRPWEFYICQEIKARIKDPFMLPGYMDISTAFLGDNASLFVSEYSKYGSLLDVANKIKVATTKCINEFIVFLLTSEMLSIVHHLHKSQIIHADIKPDNFLLMKIPAQEWRTPSLQLIDLGCAIDMSLFPEGTAFKELIATEGFTCTEMRERKPWTYQTDLYCLAGTIHVILMGSYMKVANRLGQWNIDKKLPRYMKVSLWDKIFTTLLNVPDCNTLPDLMDLKGDVDNLLNSNENINSLSSHLRNFANVLKSR